MALSEKTREWVFLGDTGLVPTFLHYTDDTGTPVTQPSIVEDANGYYYFDYGTITTALHWALNPVGDVERASGVINIYTLSIAEKQNMQDGVVSEIDINEGKLDAIQTTVNATDTTVQTNLDTIISSRATNADILSATSALALETTSQTILSQAQLSLKLAKNRLELVDGSVNNWILYDDDDSTPLLTFSVVDKNNNGISLPSGAPAKRTRGL
jgi:hypothetical protein